MRRRAGRRAFKASRRACVAAVHKGSIRCIGLRSLSPSRWRRACPASPARRRPTQVARFDERDVRRAIPRQAAGLRPQAMYAVRTNGQEFVAFATAQGVVFFFGDQISQPTPTDQSSRSTIRASTCRTTNGLKRSPAWTCHLTTHGAGGRSRRSTATRRTSTQTARTLPTERRHDLPTPK